MSSLERPVEYAAFAVVRNPEDPAEVLVVRRPEDDNHLPDVWGLPATPVGDDEGFPVAVERLGRDKLGVELSADEFMGRGTIDRGDYLLHGELYDARLVSGTPEVPQPAGEKPGTQYVDWQWVTEVEAADLLRETARMGSLCTNIYLASLGEKPPLEF